MVFIIGYNKNLIPSLNHASQIELKSMHNFLLKMQKK
jgi:hypothetical protein